MNPEQAQKLGSRLRTRREELGWSVRDLQELARIDNGTIVRIEQGAFAAPRPDKLSRIAEALALSLADVYALADYTVPSELPSFEPYLRTKYRDLPEDAIQELDRAFSRIARKHGYDPEGASGGADELAEPALSNEPRRKEGT